MAIKKIPDRDEKIAEYTDRPNEPESDSENSDSDIPELEDMEDDEPIGQPTEREHYLRCERNEAALLTTQRQSIERPDPTSDDTQRLFQHSFYDTSFDSGAEPQPDNVIRRIMTSEGARGYIIRFNGTTSTINDEQINNPWTWPTYGSSAWRLSFEAGRRTRSVNGNTKRR